MSEDGGADRRLVDKNLIWSATAEGISDTQLQAMRMRDANAIRPIPSRTAMGYDHLMADADRTALLAEVDRLREALDELQLHLAEGNASDGHHTHNELYRFRVVLHAFAVRTWIGEGYTVVKSWRHHDGEEPFGGIGWFIVVADLPEGQASNHYHGQYWDLFDLPQVERAPLWDGHTSDQALERMLAALSVTRPC